MKITFLVTRLDKPSTRFRVLQFIPFLEKSGFQTEVLIIPDSFIDRVRLFSSLRSSDIVFLQRKLFGPLDFYILRKYSKKLVYDFDDAMMFRDSKRKHYSSIKRSRGFARAARNSDIIIAGNDYLREFALKENHRSYTIPTSVDMERYTEKPLHKKTNTIILGWIGSSSTLYYLDNIKNIFDLIYDRFPGVKLKIICDSFFDCDRMPVIKSRWNKDTETDELRSFDIGLMPLTDDPWTRGKCGFKLLQYMAMGISSVCSPVGVNKDILTDGIEGFWADTEEDWIEKISILIKDHELRHQMGKKGREKIIKYYSTEHNINRLIELLRTGIRTP